MLKKQSKVMIHQMKIPQMMTRRRSQQLKLQLKPPREPSKRREVPNQLPKLIATKTAVMIHLMKMLKSQSQPNKHPERAL